MVGPEEVFRYIDAINPDTPETTPKIHESINRLFMFEARFLADAAGTMSRDVTRIIPIIFRLTVITTAITINNRYSKSRTFIPSIRARSLLKVIYRSGFRKTSSIVIVSRLNRKISKRSIVVIASISPKR